MNLKRECLGDGKTNELVIKERSIDRKRRNEVRTPVQPTPKGSKVKQRTSEVADETATPAKGTGDEAMVTPYNGKATATVGAAQRDVCPPGVPCTNLHDLKQEDSQPPGWPTFIRIT